jgi:hypothetical protein
LKSCAFGAGGLRWPSGCVVKGADEESNEAELLSPGIFDAPLTSVVEETQVKFVAWYDNEWGYSNRLVELAARLTADMEVFASAARGSLTLEKARGELDGNFHVFANATEDASWPASSSNAPGASKLWIRIGRPDFRAKISLPRP